MNLESHNIVVVDTQAIKRKEILQKIRRAAIKIQLRLGETSLQNAFLLWRELIKVERKVAEKRNVVK
jgi:hypothetical protein